MKQLRVDPASKQKALDHLEKVKRETEETSVKAKAEAVKKAEGMAE